MIQFILGGVTAVAACIGVKKYLKDDENRDKVVNTIEKGIECLDDIEKSTDEFFEKVDNYLDSKDESSKNG